MPETWNRSSRRRPTAPSAQIATPVAQDDALHGRQADARARGTRRRYAASGRARRAFRRKPCRSRPRCRARRRPGRPSSSVEPNSMRATGYLARKPGVAEQVVEDRAREPEVDVRARSSSSHGRSPPSGSDRLREGDRRTLERSPTSPRARVSASLPRHSRQGRGDRR